MGFGWQRVTRHPAVDVAALNVPRPVVSDIQTTVQVIERLGAVLDQCDHLELEVREAALSALLDEVRDLRAAGSTWFADEPEPAPVAVEERAAAAVVVRRPRGRPRKTEAPGAPEPRVTCYDGHQEA